MSKNEVIEGGITIYTPRGGFMHFSKVFQLVHTDIVVGILDREVRQN